MNEKVQKWRKEKHLNEMKLVSYNTLAAKVYFQ